MFIFQFPAMTGLRTLAPHFSLLANLRPRGSEFGTMYVSFAKEALANITDMPISFEVFSDDLNEMEDQAYNPMPNNCLPSFCMRCNH